MKNLKISIYFLLLVVVTLSCEKDTTEFPLDSELNNVKIESSKINDASKGAKDKISICHYDVKKDRWFVIDVNENAFSNLAAHGDKILIDADGDGYVVEINECVPGGDCDDTDASINPDTVWYADIDNDGYGDANTSETGCISTLQNATQDNTDCDDDYYSEDNSCIQIGDFHEGGIVFYIADVPTDLDGDGDLDNGLIAATSDQYAAWGCSGIGISGADGYVRGTGAQNTIDIEAGCTTAGTAADICSNYTNTDIGTGVYSDWFLPSINELILIYSNIGQGASAPNTNIGNFAYAFYWSSTENNNFSAWGQNFGDGKQGSGFKDNSFKVCVVRAF